MKRSDRRLILSSLLFAIIAGLVVLSTSATILSAPVIIADAQTLDRSCVTYDAERNQIRLLCGNVTLPLISSILGNDNLLSEDSPRVWHLKTDIEVSDEAFLSITNKDTDWLKLETPYGIVAFGDVVINSTKVTSWDSLTNTYAATDGKRPRSFITAWDFGKGQLNITNSEIAYLGYHLSHKQGLAYYSGDGSILKNNNIHHMWYGFYSNNVTGINIEGNEIHDNVVYGLDPHTGTRNMVIRNNVVYNITKGIGIICSFTCDNILMENNVVYDVNVVGLMLSRNSTNSVIRNNLVYNSGTNGGGISVDESSMNKVYNNTVSVGRFGIKVSMNSNNNEIFNNTISDYSSYGICVFDGSTYNTIYENKISNMGEYGICALRGGSDNNVSSNWITGTGYYGIYVRDIDATGNVFTGNSITYSNQNGVRVFNNTESTFINNTVKSSTKADYSTAEGSLLLVDTTFSSTYFDGSGVNATSRVNILNTDGRLIAADMAMENSVRADGSVSVGFALKSGGAAILNTLPFSVKPDTGTIKVSVIEGNLLTESPRITWVEKVGWLTDTGVSHRLDGLKPGIAVEVSADDVGTTEYEVGPDGVLEFSTTSRLGTETTYSLLASGIAALGDPSEITDVFDKPDGSNDLKTYGCEIYSSVVHCDPVLGDFTSYTVEGKFKQVQPLSTSSGSYVEGKYSEALKLSARYRESVEVMNTPALANGNFTVSFWIRNSDEAEPYGQIASHINFAGTAGWLIDMTSSTEGQPFEQKLQFGVTNMQGQLIAPPESDIPQDKFVHIAGVYDGSVVKLYVDGILAGEASYKGQYNPDPGTPLRLGSASYSTSTHRWSGIIDDMALFNRPLSGEEIAKLAAQSDSAITVDETEGGSVVAHWTFDNDVTDVSGQGNDGAHSTLLASMAFAPDGRLFFSEKNTGNIRIMKDDEILPEPFAHIPDVYVSWEQGLLGLTLDSNFEENRFVYQYYTYMNPATGEVFNRIVRFKDVDNKGTEMKVLLDNIPAVKGYHSGGALAFGQDDKLYVTVGDATEHPFAQDSNVLVGKVLRINRDGSIPSDNPNPNSPVYTKGHRNMYGIAFDDNGTGIITENGEAAYDEINVIEKGGNYGFPTLQPANIAPELADPSMSILPARSYFETIAPTQAIYYEGNKIPQLEGRFLFGTFTGKIYALKVDLTTKRVIGEERIGLYPTLFTPVIGIAQAPNGDIYYGSYGIFKLESLKLGTRIPVTYPIKVASSKDLSIESFVFDQDTKRIALNVSIKEPAAADPASNDNQDLTRKVSVKIPRRLMDEITTVQNDNGTPLNFRVTSEGGGLTEGYNIVTVGLDDAAGNSNVSIIAARVIPEFPVWTPVPVFGLFVAMVLLLNRSKFGFGLGRTP